jgi:hypothetical protein
MFNLIINNIFILIPLAIIIGRVIIYAQKKRQPPPAAPKIPVHFEDDAKPLLSRGADKFFKGTGKNTTPPRPNRGVEASLAALAPVPPVTEPKPADTFAQNGFLNLNKLSRLKQAVVMSEILGPPKGLQ